MRGIGSPKKTKRCGRSRRKTMTETFGLLLAWAVGGVLGGIFFGGLWWTVRKSIASRQPALWFLGSFLLRTAVVLAGLYLIGRGQWERLAVCLVGFVMARFIVMWLTRSSGKNATPAAQEAHHAP